MFISEIDIENYRSFKNCKILFSPGLNVLIGHNNAGKTNVIKALQLVFDSKYRNKLTIDDFNYTYSDFSIPPKIEIRITIAQNNTITQISNEIDDRNVIYDWLVEEKKPYKALLTYIFELPSKHFNDYTLEVDKFKIEVGKYNTKACFKLIEKKYLQKYVSTIYGGDPKKRERVDNDLLEKFDFQFLDAIRDAEKQIFYGNNTLLRDILNYFLDYDLTKGQDFDDLIDEHRLELLQREIEFKKKSESLLQHLIGRISKDQILEYSKETGANKGGAPDLDAEVTELELLFALRLIVEKNGFKIPIKNNGLGYNNLLFISLILAKIQMERSSFMGENAKVFPILAIEEPEAHLHPSMQYKFLKFLNKNLHENKQARQIFISTHSTQITSAVDLDSIICLYEDCDGNQRIGYPAKAFEETLEDKASKIYVKRFLDATKSNMLFADKIIFVEGLAEQLLLPCFAAYLHKEDLLLDSHVAIISVDSRTFKHFLKIYAFHQDNKPFGIRKKVVCITDADPARKEKDESNNKKRWKSCYPFELSLENDKYDYQPIASHVEEITNYSASYNHIKICVPLSGVGKTLEYELALSNPTNQMLLTECFPKKGQNRRDFFEELIKKQLEGCTLKDLLIDSLHTELNDVAIKCVWDEEVKKKAFFASIYHLAVENIKGEHAFHLEKQLRENLEKKDGKVKFIIPIYLTEAIDFISE